MNNQIQQHETLLDVIYRKKLEFENSTYSYNPSLHSLFVLIPENLKQKINEEVHDKVMFLSFVANITDEGIIDVKAFFYAGMRLIFSENIEEITIVAKMV